MSNAISEASLSRLSRLVVSHTGLHFPKEKWHDLRRALEKAAPTLGFDTAEACAEWLLAQPAHEQRIETLITYLTVGETHFFRDGKLFQALEEKFLPELIHSRRTNGRVLRIWSAGCATGEEPYSIAIVLSRLLAHVSNGPANILATDLNREFLRKAAEGVYSDWSFRSVPEGVKEAYFSIHGDEARLLPDIKKMVQFSHHNLARDPYPLGWGETEPMDLIFCRNVIMYFTLERQEQIINKLCECLAEGGLLVVSPAEASSVTNPHLVPVNHPGVVMFRKNSCAQAPKVFQPIFSFPDAEFTSDPFPGQFRYSWLEEQPPSVEPIPLPIFDLVDDKPQPVTDAFDSADVELELNPYVQGLTLYEEGRYAEAIQQLLLEVQTNAFQQSGTAIALLSRAYANQGRLDEALAWSEKAVSSDKLNADYHYLHATILQEMGKDQEAVASLNRAVFLNPNLVAAHFALGNLLLRMGNRKQSDRHFKIALTILGNYGDDDAVPSTEGMNARRLTEIILSMTRKERLA